jgi:hypothetical protein
MEQLELEMLTIKLMHFIKLNKVTLPDMITALAIISNRKPDERKESNALRFEE